MEKIIAPWTPEQVEQLNRYQQNGYYFHPFTCGHKPESVPLEARELGWYCPHDPHSSQNWAWELMADKAWMDEVDSF